MRRAWLSIAAALAFPACTAHVSSHVKVNGVPFSPSTCVSGEGRGFPGVELADTQGNRLRMGTNLDGTSAVAFFTPGSQVGDNLGACAWLDVEQGTGVINGVRNLEGTANLACRSDRHQIEGSVHFNNCH